MNQSNAIKQLGWPGVSGLVLLAAAAGFYQGQLQPLEQRLAAIKGGQDESLLLERERSEAQLPRVDAWQQQLPDAQQALDMLAKIYLLAEDSGVEYKQAKYHLITEPGREYRLTIPAEGEYKNLRYFVSRVLLEMPAVSLDAFSIKREQVTERRLQADIRLTIFLRTAKEDGHE